MQQVALNLLMNAFDVVQECETPRRRCGCARHDATSTAVVEVSDWGAGLTDEALANLFEPFRTTKREGIGLGSVDLPADHDRPRRNAVGQPQP